MSGERMLTVRNPWARGFFLPAGAKDIENRTWRPGRFGRIGVHVALRLEDDRYIIGGVVDEERKDEHRRDRGLVIGSIRIASVHRQDSYECRQMGCRLNPWAMFNDEQSGDRPLYHWEVDQPREFVTPFEAKGRLQLWIPTPTEAGRFRMAELEALDNGRGSQPQFR